MQHYFPRGSPAGCPLPCSPLTSLASISRILYSPAELFPTLPYPTFHFTTPLIDSLKHKQNTYTHIHIYTFTLCMHIHILLTFYTSIVK